MNFELFLKNIEVFKNTQLPGIEAQFKLAPKMRLEYNAKKIEANNPKIAAVLALFYPNQNNEVSLLLTKRANYIGTHSGQISFPGGKFEKSDLNLKETALRETFEEVGIFQEKIDIVRWNESSQVLISNALKPAEVDDVSLCFELGRATIIVRDDQLSLAIGRRGQNVRLAARLTGWDIDILTPEEYQKLLREEKQ